MLNNELQKSSAGQISIIKYLITTIVRATLMGSIYGAVISYFLLDLKSEKLLFSIAAYFFAGTLIGAISAVKNSKAFIIPGNIASSFLNDLHNGNLNSSIEVTKSKIFDQITKTQESLRSSIGSISNVSKDILNTSDELYQISLEVAEASANTANNAAHVRDMCDEQLKTAESVLGVTNTIGNKITNLSLQSKDASDFLINVNKASSIGKEKVTDLKESVENNLLSLQNVNTAIKNLDSKIKNIVEITNNITSISEQTKLLSLNASIEAARAGAAGQGFAVVAEEIQKLADSSSKSVSQIMFIINELQNEATNTINATHTINKSYDNQTVVTNNTITAFSDITGIVTDFTEKISTMNTSIAQISDLKNDILSLLDYLLNILQKSTKCTNEISSYTEEVSSISENINSSVGILKSYAHTLNNSINQFKL